MVPQKIVVKCSVFTTVCFMYNSILGVTTQGKLCKDDSKGQGIPTENRRKI